MNQASNARTTAALQARAAERQAERDRRDGEPRATVRRMIRHVQNAAHNGETEAERAAADVVEQLVAMIERAVPDDGTGARLGPPAGFARLADDPDVTVSFGPSGNVARCNLCGATSGASHGMAPPPIEHAPDCHR